jgi:hypothetical protein
MSLATELQAIIDQISDDEALLYTFVNGDINTVVNGAGGTYPSLAKMVNDFPLGFYTKGEIADFLALKATIESPTFTGTVTAPLINAGTIDFDPANTGGELSWNNVEKTLDLVTGSDNVTIQLGQEVVLYARNKSGLQMTDGQVVKVVGSQGNNPTIALAQADTVANARGVIGVVTQIIPNNSNGFISLIGKVRDLTLDSGTYTEGDLLYLSNTVAGGLTKVRPDIGVAIGRVIATSSGGNNAGVLEVSIDSEVAVHELEQDVIANAAAIAAKVPNASTTGTPSAYTFLRGDNAWASLTGGGDMLKSVYDPSNKNVTAFSMGNMDETATAKILTNTERSEIAANTSKVGITPTQASDITANNAKVGITPTQANDITANNAKVGITPTQAADITTNNAKVGITPTQASDIVTNNAKVGITTAQAADIVTNNAKVGITPTQAADITANNAKVTNANHTGDVTGDTALTIAVDAVDIPMLSATGTPDGTTFLRGDNVWATPAGGGDVATDAIWDAKGDLAGGTGANAAARLAVGANNQVLTADSAEATGMKWTTIAGGAPVDASETVSGVVQIPTDLEVVNATTTGSTGAELPILVTQAALLAGYTTQPSLFTDLRGKLKTPAFPDVSLPTSYGYLRLTQPAGDLAATDYGFVFTGGSYNPSIGQNIYNFNWNAKYVQFSVLHTFNTITSTAHSIYWDFGSHYSVADGSTELTRKGIGFRLGIVSGVKTLYGTSYGTAYNEVNFGTLNVGNILQLLARKVGNTIEWWVNGNLAGSINSTTNPTHVPSGTSGNYQHKYRCGIHMDAAVVGGTSSLHYLSEPIITVLPA